MERKKYLADFWNLAFVFPLNFGTNFGGKLDKNQPKKCRKVEKSVFVFTCSQCISTIFEKRKSIAIMGLEDSRKVSTGRRGEA